MKFESEIGRQKFEEQKITFSSLFDEADDESFLQTMLTSPTLTIQREGRILYQLNTGYQTSEVPLQALGPVPDRPLQFLGSEPSSDTALRKGTSSDVFTFDAIEEIPMTARDLSHPDGRTRVFATSPTMTGLWLGARVQGGLRVIDDENYTDTSATASIECTYSNKFVFAASPDEEMFLGWVIPTRWDGNTSEPGAPRIFGKFTLIVSNASRGRVLWTRNSLNVTGGSPGQINLAAIEYEIRQGYAHLISDGEVVEVQVVHRVVATSWGTGGVNYIGAGTGFTLLPVTLK